MPKSLLRPEYSILHVNYSEAGATASELPVRQEEVCYFDAAHVNLVGRAAALCLRRLRSFAVNREQVLKA